jgi:hypothetical protein
MFYNPMVVSTTVTPNGKTLSIIDPEAVQQAFQSISNESSVVDNKLLQLTNRITELEAFTRYCAQHYPDVINEFTLATLAKERLGVKGLKQ